MKHTICCMVENKFGVLARIAGLFSSRGFNIDSLAVGETEDPTVSRMTIVLDADERILEQVIKQLRKLIDVIKVIDFKNEEFIDRDLMLVKVSSSSATRKEIIELATIFRANVLDIGSESCTLEITGRESKIEAFLKLLNPYGIKEVAHTGVVAMARGKK